MAKKQEPITAPAPPDPPESSSAFVVEDPAPLSAEPAPSAPEPLPPAQTGEAIWIELLAIESRAASRQCFDFGCVVMPTSGEETMRTDLPDGVFRRAGARWQISVLDGVVKSIVAREMIAFAFTKDTEIPAP